MTKNLKKRIFVNAYVTKKRGEEDIYLVNETLPKEWQEAILAIQHKLNEETGTFELDYDIMADACDIIADKTLTGKGRDSLVGDELDFYADADSRANVYTGVQLSYLCPQNESEISVLMKDEAITSIAQACSIWRTEKVARACELIKEYIFSK